MPAPNPTPAPAPPAAPAPTAPPAPADDRARTFDLVVRNKVTDVTHCASLTVTIPPGLEPIGNALLESIERGLPSHGNTSVFATVHTRQYEGVPAVWRHRLPPPPPNLPEAGPPGEPPPRPTPKLKRGRRATR